MAFHETAVKIAGSNFRCPSYATTRWSVSFRCCEAVSPDVLNAILVTGGRERCQPVQDVRVVGEGFLVAGTWAVVVVLMPVAQSPLESPALPPSASPGRLINASRGGDTAASQAVICDDSYERISSGKHKAEQSTKLILIYNPPFLPRLLFLLNLEPARYINQ
jgi:hypothetical protein